MGQHEQGTALLDIMDRHGRLDAAAAAEELPVSAATIRRGLDRLAGPNLGAGYTDADVHVNRA